METRPIIFSGEMVRAILAGRKTQTRRVVNRLLGRGPITEFGRSDTPGYAWHFRDKAMRWHDVSHLRLLEMCPYGVPGDGLWCRESFALCDWVGLHLPVSRDGKEPGSVAYRADGDNEGFGLRWRPSIHMPRWASRITLSVESVGVQRLQDISEEDARAEGAVEWNNERRKAGTWTAEWPSARYSFRSLWNSIHGPGAWERNDWVWAVTFRRVQP